MRGLADQLANLILIANFLCWVEEGRLLERGPLAAEIKRRIVNAFFRQTVAALWWEMPTRRTALKSRANEPWPQTQKYWERAPSSPLQYDAAVRPVVIKMGNTGRHFPRLPAAIYDPSTTRLQKKRKLWAVGFFCFLIFASIRTSLAFPHDGKVAIFDRNPFVLSVLLGFNLCVRSFVTDDDVIRKWVYFEDFMIWWVRGFLEFIQDYSIVFSSILTYAYTVR